MIPTASARAAAAPHGAGGATGTHGTAGAAETRDRSRALRIAGPVILVAAALIATLWALAFGGGAAPLQLGDPGPLVRWGLPVATLVVNLSAAGLCGTLVTALYALRAGDKPFEIAMVAASFSAAVFTVAAATTGFLTFMLTFNPTLSLNDTFGGQLGGWLTATEAGRTWLITTLAGAVLTLLTFAVRGWTAVLLTAMLALATLVPMGTQGHSGELSSHDIAVSAMIGHMMGAAVWLGGLLLMVLIRPVMTRGAMADVLERYSSIALLAFIVVAASGIARAWVSLGSLAGLASGYGVIVLVKACALIALGAFGAVYRMRLISGLRQDGASRRFWGMVVGELAIMGIASGAAVALARTAPPTGTELPTARTPAEILTGQPLPPELTPARWITEWNIDLLWLAVAVFGTFFYLAAVWRLHRRGDKWPVYRTVFWVLGMLVLLWTTSGATNAYQEYLFSMHMVGHMILTMLVPVLLVPGAPITLALRAIAKRKDGTRGGREWILWAVHAPYAKVITHPVVAGVIFAGSLWVFYFTDLFRWSMYDHLGHEWMVFHFIVSGFLFVEVMIGIDPIPYRPPHSMRVLMLVLVMATHAFFGVALMMQSSLMVAEWFGSMGRTWGAPPMVDQFVGAGVAWTISEIPTLILAIVVAMEWSRSDEKLQRRHDREADRTGEAELNAYNERLAALAAKDARDAEREARAAERAAAARR